MMLPDVRLSVVLKEMRDAATNAIGDIEGMTLAAFLTNGSRQRAVAMSLVIIGGLANTIDRRHSDFVTRYRQVNLTGMRDMRNRIAHGYSNLHFPTIWAIVSDELPPLIEQLDIILTQLGH